MKASAILFTNFLGYNFSEFTKSRKIAEIFFESNESMTEFYDYCSENGLRAIKITSDESKKCYFLQFLIDGITTLEKLKLLTVQITLE